MVLPRGRLLGVDLGSRRIGLALSDETQTLATPLGVLKRSSNAQVLGSLRQIAERHGVVGVVVGLPRSLDGTRGPQARAVERDAARLVGPLGLPMELWDERLSTWEAERLDRQAGGRGGRGRKDLDARAAAVILQGYLDRSQEGQGRGAP